MIKYGSVDEFMTLKNLKGIELSEYHYEQLTKIIYKYNNYELRNLYQPIKCFIKYDVHDNIEWIDRIEIIKNKLFRDSSSLYSHVIRYGEEYGTKIFNEKCLRTTMTLKGYIKKHGEIEGRLLWKSKYARVGCSLKLFIEKYGEDEGKKRFFIYVKQRKLKYLENKKNGFKYRNGRTLSEYIKLYGEELGSTKYYKRNNEHSYRFSLNHYILKYGNDEGNIRWEKYKRTMNKCSLEAYIEKYGNTVGKEKYNKRIEFLKYFNSLEYYNQKYGVELGQIKWDEYRNKTIFKKSKYSKISQELFWNIYNKLDVELKKYCYFAELNSEYFFRIKNDIIFSDFKLNNLVIEFD